MDGRSERSHATKAISRTSYRRSSDGDSQCPRGISGPVIGLMVSWQSALMPVLCCTVSLLCPLFPYTPHSINPQSIYMSGQYVCISIYLSIYHPPIYLFIYVSSMSDLLSIHLSTHLSVPIYLPTYLCIYLYSVNITELLYNLLYHLYISFNLSC